MPAVRYFQRDRRGKVVYPIILQELLLQELDEQGPGEE